MQGCRRILSVACPGCACAGIPTLVLLTKIDDYDPEVIGADVKRAFHSIRLRAVITVRVRSSPCCSACWPSQWLSAALALAPALCRHLLGDNQGGTFSS